MKRIITALCIGAMAMGCAKQANNKTQEAQEENVAAVAAEPETEEAEDEEEGGKREYSYFFEQYNKPFKVKGGVGIEQFVSALGMDNGEGWEEENFDKANGYFEYSEEGDGMYGLNAAYWNRKDGKKMFIVAFYISDQMYDDKSIERKNEWYRVILTHPETDMPEFTAMVESGVLAYLYNEETQTLEPMDKCPFANMPSTEDVFSFIMPQKGKDITVGQYDKNNVQKWVDHKLKFNGLTFDYVE